PGNNVISLMAPNSTLATQNPRLLVDVGTYDPGVQGKSGNYMRLSGTSMATPAVSGAAALLLQQTPTLNPDQVKGRLMKSARKSMPLYSTSVDAITFASYADQSDILTVGAGALDIQAALANTDLVTLPALSPTVTLVTSHNVTMLRSFSVIWGDSVIW